MHWYHLAQVPGELRIDFDLAGRIFEILPRVIPEAGPGMYCDDLTNEQVERIREALKKEQP